MDRMPEYIDRLNDSKLSQFIFKERKSNKMMQSFRNAQFKKDLSEKPVSTDTFSLIQENDYVFPKGRVFDFKLSDRTLELTSKSKKDSLEQSTASLSKLKVGPKPAAEHDSGVLLGNYVDVDFGLKQDAKTRNDEEAAPA